MTVDILFQWPPAKNTQPSQFHDSEKNDHLLVLESWHRRKWIWGEWTLDVDVNSRLPKQLLTHWHVWVYNSMSVHFLHFFLLSPLLCATCFFLSFFFQYTPTAEEAVIIPYIRSSHCHAQFNHDLSNCLC